MININQTANIHNVIKQNYVRYNTSAIKLNFYTVDNQDIYNSEYYKIIKFYECPHCNHEYKICNISGLSNIYVIPNVKCSLSNILATIEHQPGFQTIQELEKFLHEYYNSSQYTTDCKASIIKSL